MLCTSPRSIIRLICEVCAAREAVRCGETEGRGIAVGEWREEDDASARVPDVVSAVMDTERENIYQRKRTKDDNARCLCQDTTTQRFEGLNEPAEPGGTAENPSYLVHHSSVATLVSRKET